MPSVDKGYVGLYTSTITVQNADPANPAVVTVTYKDGNGNDAGQERATLQPNAAITFDQSNASQLPAGFVGSAVVQSTGGQNNQTKTVADVQPGASALFYQPNDGLPNGFNGSVTVRSSAAKVVGVVNELSLARPNPGDWLLTYDGFSR